METLETAYAAGVDDHEHVCSGTGAHAPESLEALVASTEYWVTPPESPAHAEAWARGWLAAHQACVAQGIARARADAAEDATHQPEVQLDLTDDADLREACRNEFARYDYTNAQVAAWVRGYRESATRPLTGR